MDSLYRYQITGSSDAPRIMLMTIPIERRTSKGAWLQDGRFVLLTANKKYACETIGAARESFLARTARWREILSRNIKLIDIAMSDLETKGWPDERKNNGEDDGPRWLSFFE